jgi:hypothetical protein
VAHCEAQVSAESFTANGSINFSVQVLNCLNSDGEFEFTYSVRRPDGVTSDEDRTGNWKVRGASSLQWTDDLNLPGGHEVLSVTIHGATVECTCSDKVGQ